MPKRHEDDEEPFEEERMTTRGDPRFKGDLMADIGRRSERGALQGDSSLVKVARRGLTVLYRVPESVKNLVIDDTNPIADINRRGKFYVATLEAVKVMGDDGYAHYCLLTAPMKNRQTEFLKLYAGKIANDSLTISSTSYTRFLLTEEWDLETADSDSESGSSTSTDAVSLLTPTVVLPYAIPLNVLGNAVLKCKLETNGYCQITSIKADLVKINSSGVSAVIATKTISGDPLQAVSTETMYTMLLALATNAAGERYDSIESGSYLALLLTITGKSTDGTSAQVTLHYGKGTDELSVVVPVSR